MTQDPRLDRGATVGRNGAALREHFLVYGQLQSSRACSPQSAHHAGDDQVGALDFRPAVCALRGDAGSRGYPIYASAFVDYCCHGCSAFGGHGFQSLGRRGD